MKLCESCIYRNQDEYHKPCIVYRDDCEFYEREGDMTREEAIRNLQFVRNNLNDSTKIAKAYDMAIKALEQEPCDDAISRDAVLKAIDVKAWEFCDYLISEGRNDEQKPVSHFADNLRECVSEDLPSVTPQEPNFCQSCKHYDDNEVCLECEYDGITRGMTRYESVLQEPKTGHWKRVSIDLYVQHAMAYYKCSECGEKVIGEHNYCPNCGCRMVEPQESEDEE